MLFKDNKSQQSSSGQPHSPLALLAATCSKLEETGSESPQPQQAGGKNQQNSQANNVQQTVKVINTGSQVINAADLAQYMQLATPGQTLGIVNPDGTVTQINPQVASSIGSVANTTQIKPVTSIANQSQLTQLSQGATQISSGGVAYSIIPAQQIQNIQIDGQDAIYIPASSFSTAGQQTFQIAGNQIFAQQPNQQATQGVVRTSAGQTTPTTQTAVIQGLNNMNLTQLAGGQTVALRQGNIMQTLQLPINSLQQTVPVHIQMQTQNGQTIYQPMQLPISALSSLTGQQVIQQMPQQIQMAQIQLPQQATSAGTIKEENQANSQNQVNSNQQTANQNIIATINLPNGQLGQIIAAPQAQTVWPANALNLSNLTSKLLIVCQHQFGYCCDAELLILSIFLFLNSCTSSRWWTTTNNCRLSGCSSKFRFEFGR